MNRAVVAHQDGPRKAGPRIPDADLPERAGGGDERPLRRERDRAERVGPGRSVPRLVLGVDQFRALAETVQVGPGEVAQVGRAAGSRLPAGVSARRGSRSHMPPPERVAGRTPRGGAPRSPASTPRSACPHRSGAFRSRGRGPRPPCVFRSLSSASSSALRRSPPRSPARSASARPRRVTWLYATDSTATSATVAAIVTVPEYGQRRVPLGPLHHAAPRRRAAGP